MPSKNRAISALGRSTIRVAERELYLFTAAFCGSVSMSLEACETAR